MNLRFLVFLGLLLPLALYAQNASDDAQLKPLFGKGSKEKVADKKDISPYLQGAVPTVDGQVEFKASFPSKMNKQEMMDALQQWANAYFVPAARTQFTEPTQAQIRNVDVANGKIICVGDEYIVFARRKFKLDQSRIHYFLTLTCHDQLCEIVMSRIYYDYNNSAQEGVMIRIPAEEQITDKYALRSNHTKLVRETGTKFRVHTVDLKNGLFESIRQVVE